MSISAINSDLWARCVRAVAEELAKQDCDTCFDEPDDVSRECRERYIGRAERVFSTAYDVLREG